MEKNIGNYQILKSIGKGGMGEVFLVYDAFCERTVALKQMRPEWSANATMQERFFREARIAAQLAHPNIIPIYTIEPSYYTMPYIEGETLKEILRKTRAQSKNGEPLHPIGSSITSLIRIFLSVCSAIEYAHARGFLHQDLKPENIIVGKYGEVIILDWGLADLIQAKNLSTKTTPLPSNKIAGTLLYMAPERALHGTFSVLTDMYSLGVILYQILCLQAPFERPSLKEYRKIHSYEKFLDPEEAAPDREISPHLSNIVKKCLEKNPLHRYQTIRDLVKDLEDYIEGTPEWLEAATLVVNRKSDWQFQENIALTKHMAITHEIDSLEWVNLMISKAHFPGNIQITADFTLKENSKGVGILFCVAETQWQNRLEAAYCLWITEQNIRLSRSNIEIYHYQETLSVNQSYVFKLILIDNHIRFFLNGVQKFSFLSHTSLTGSQVGLLTKDGDFFLSEMKIAIGSQNIMVNCLAVPDAFLSRQYYDEALLEYRKISHSFPGRSEGREATFRAGVTLLRKGCHHKTKKPKLFHQALAEFEKLHNTPGGPLEYLGKSLVYKEEGDFTEETKCLELAIRKFSKHPLKPILEEHILSRLHEASQSMRHVAYLFALLVLRHLSYVADALTITAVLEKSLEKLSFFRPSSNPMHDLVMQLAFWLNKPLVLLEMLQQDLSSIEIQNGQLGLQLLGYKIEKKPLISKDSPPAILEANFEYCLKNRLPFGPLVPSSPSTLWAALQNQQKELARAIVQSISHESLTNESSPYFFLYGCYLAQERGRKVAKEHLTAITEKAFPPLSTLLSHYLIGRKKPWKSKPFFWEKLKLLQQLELYAICSKNTLLLKKTKINLKNLLKDQSSYTN